MKELEAVVMKREGENLVEGVDYYVDDDGLYVFTRAYHLKRGYCCESGCRNCPYGFVKPRARRE